MRRFLLSLTFLFSILLTKAQTPQQKIVDRVTSTFSIHQSVRINNYIYSIGETEGSTHHPNLLKQDLNLNTEYITRVLRPSTDFDPIIMNQMIVTPDQHIIVAGNQLENGETPIWYFKMDTMLNIIWEKDVSTVGEQEPYDLFLNPTGGATILASETVGGIGGVNTIQVINFDANGDTLWTQKIATTPGVVSRYPMGYWDINGDLVVRVRNGWDAEFFKMDAQGNFLNYSEYQVSTGEKLYIHNAVNHNGSTYMVGQVNGGSSCILKTDASGNPIWCKTYSFSSRAYSVMINSDDEIYVSVSYGVLKTDIDGNVLAAMNYGKSPYSHALYSDIVDVNGMVLVSGLRQYQSNITGYQLMLDSNLSSGTCYERRRSPIVTSISVTKNSLPEPSNGSLQSDILFYGTNPNAGWFLGTTATDYILDNTIIPTYEITGDDCGGGCDGSVSVSAFGADGPYNYEWSNGQTGSVASGICDGEEIGLEISDQLWCYLYDTIVMIQQTPVNDICVVTVDSSSTKNEVIWEKPISSAIQGFGVYREAAGNYTLVGYVPYDSLSRFIDNTNGVNPNVTSYRYKITTLDTCGYESELSDYHETIHLTVNQGVGGVTNLIWDNYEGFTFSYNRIWKDSLGDGSWELKDSVSSNVFTWTDPYSASSVTGYLIEVVSPSICTSTRAVSYGSTRSNKSTIMGPSVEVGIEEELSAANFNVFPNPTNSFFRLTLNTTEKGDLYVYDAHGRLVKSFGLNNQTSIIEIPELESGVYFLQVIIGDDSTTKKLIKN